MSMDVDEQAKILEQIQRELDAAGYVTEQVPDGQQLRLIVERPGTHARQGSIRIAADEDGSPVCHWMVGPPWICSSCTPAAMTRQMVQQMSSSRRDP